MRNCPYRRWSLLLVVWLEWLFGASDSFFLSTPPAITCFGGRVLNIEQARFRQRLTSLKMQGHGNATGSTSAPSRFLMPPQPPIPTFEEHNQSNKSEAYPRDYDSLLDTIVELQSKKLDSIRLLRESQIPPDLSARNINSIIFTVYTKSSSADRPFEYYVLAILDQSDRVNMTQLEEVVVKSTTFVDGDERRDLLSLAPIDQLSRICGFSAGTVPPIGLTPAPLLTVVEQSLVYPPSDKDLPSLLIGGGGRANQSILLPVQTILDSWSETNKITVAAFRKVSGGDAKSSKVTTNGLSELFTTGVGRQFSILEGNQDELYQKPYFSIAPPDTELATRTVNNDRTVDNATLVPEWVAVVGRISGVRQMARRLVFCDLAPPLCMSNDTLNTTAGTSTNIHPWRSPRDGTDMAVQLIFGKTICQRLGVQQGEMNMRRLKPGQLIMIQGKTNVGNRDSLKNWLTKKSLDIVVFDILPLQTESEFSVWSTTTNPVKAVGKNRKNNSCTHVTSSTTTSPEEARDSLHVLTLRDMYPETTLESSIKLVDNLAGIHRFQSDLMGWLTTHPERVGLVGIDCEWKPNFLAGEDAQPVLLLQICLHDLQQTYLIDLQTLLRPLCPKSESKTETEEALADAISLLYETERLVKVGFQVHNDLQRLAASYPQITSFTYVNSVLEISKLGMKTMQMNNEGRRAQLITSSLIKMTERFVQRTLNKEQQISDWSLRPLSPLQIEYAALDAVVTPFVADILMSSVGAHIYFPPISLGHKANNSAFQGILSSCRFFVLDPTETLPIQRWNAKRLVGDFFLVQQTWATGETIPQLPTTPTGEVDTPFVDLNGISKIPSHIVPIDPKKIETILGTWITKSKERCVMELMDNLTMRALELDVASKLEFQPRSGYIEMKNAVLLFVTLPAKDGGSHQSRSYPNEWLEDGSILTWFIKGYEWKGGTTRLAEKMTNIISDQNCNINPVEGADRNTVILFVRRGKGIFFCCGRCRVVTVEDGSTKADKELGRRSDQWSIDKLYLLLIDFGKLQQVADFKDLVNASPRGGEKDNKDNPVERLSK